MVSPVKQTNDQVTSELRRESDGIKTSASKTENRSMKKGADKNIKKGKKKQKTQKRKFTKNNNKKKKKSVKKRIKDIFTL